MSCAPLGPLRGHFSGPLFAGCPRLISIHSLAVASSRHRFTKCQHNSVTTVSQTLSLSSGWLITARVPWVDSQFLRDGYSHQGKGHPNWHQLEHLLVLSTEWLKIDQGLTLHRLEVVFLIRYYLLSFFIFEAVLLILLQHFQPCPIGSCLPDFALD